MTGSSSVVISNLAYLIGAIVLAIIGGFAVWLYHRQPKSIDAGDAHSSPEYRSQAACFEAESASPIWLQLRPFARQ